MGYKRKGYKKRSRKPVLLFVLISVLIHILILFILSNKSDFLLPKITKTAKKDDSFIEISEIPVPKEKETEPPEKTTRYADRSRKVEKEKTRDEFTKKGSVLPPTAPKTAAQITKPQKEPKKKQVAKTEEKAEKSKQKTVSPRYSAMWIRDNPKPTKFCLELITTR